MLFSELSTMFQSVESDDPKRWMGRFYHNALSAMDCKSEGKLFLKNNITNNK